MENIRFFHVDSKSYEITREGNSKGINIFERGRNHQSNVVFGREGARWFQVVLHEVAHLPPEHKFQKTFCEGTKVFLFQKQRNDWGRYVSITEFGVSKGRGYVIISEGRDLWGWRGFSQVWVWLEKRLHSQNSTWAVAQGKQFRRGVPKLLRISSIMV